MNKNILLCGVGGQGTVLASKIIASSAMSEGYTVHSAETIGMAQRGGSVTSHVRIGDASSPLIPYGKADIIIAFEPSEAVRNLMYLKKDGTVIVNMVPVSPVTESLKPTGYDGSQMLKYLSGKCHNCIVVDAHKIETKLGSTKCLNIVLLGVVIETGVTGLQEKTVLKELKSGVAPKYLELNEKAYEMGKKIGAEYGNH